MVYKIDNITDLPTITTPSLGVAYGESDLSLQVQEYLDRLASKNNNVRGESPPSGLDIIDFISLVKNAIEHRQDFQSVPSDKRLLFLGEDPPEEVDTEAITFELTLRAPGSFSQGPAGKGAVKEVSAHVRARIKHPENPGERLYTLGRKYDNYVTFYTYAKNNITSLKRAIWLEDLMDAYSWYFGIFGFKVVQQQVDKKEIVNIGELKLRRYPIRYIVLSDKTFHVTSQELVAVALDVDLSNG